MEWNAMQCDLPLHKSAFEPTIRDFGTIDWFRELALDQKRHRKLKENTKDKSATFVTNIKGNFWPIRILLFITSKSGNWFKNLICSNCRFLQFSQICIIKLSSIIYGVWFNSLWSCGFFFISWSPGLFRFISNKYILWEGVKIQHQRFE